MEPTTSKPVRPALDPISNIVLGALELGELHLARSRLQAPRWRLHTLLALISAARDFGFSTRTMEPEVRSCLDALLAGHRGEVLGKVGPVVREHIQTWIGKNTAGHGEALQDLAASLSVSRYLAPLHCVQALLGAGQLQRARKLAAEWNDPVVRRRLERVTTTGLLGHDRHRRFVARPFDDDFPPSLPRVIAMTGAPRPGKPLTATQLTRVENLLRQLKPADRQMGLAHLAGAVYPTGGLAAGEGVVRAIRYRGCRRLARLRLLMASLEAGHTSDAWRTLERIPAGAFRERAGLLLIRHLIRQGRRRRARRLLAGPCATPRLEERAQLLCEIEPRRVRSVWPRWRDGASRASEDLALLDRRLPSLEHRWTILALRAALRHGLPEDDRRSVRRTIWIPAKYFRNLARDRTAIRSWLRDVEADGHELSSVLHVVRWVALDAVEPIRSEYLSRRAFRLGQTSGEPPPRRLVEAFARGLFARDTPSTNRHAVSAESCAYDEGVSLSPRAGRRRRVVLGAVKHCLKTWLVEGSRPQEGAFESRLRTLANLGGGLAAEQLARILERAREPNAAYHRAFAALTSMAPESAARLLFGRLSHLLLEHPARVRETLLGLEDHGVLEPGFNWPWGRLTARVRLRFGVTRGATWLRQLLAAWPGAPQTLPTFAAIECCASEVKGHWPATGDQLITRAQRHVEFLRRTPTSRLPAALLEDPLAIKRLLWLRPGISRGARRESEAAWRTDLATLRDEVGEIDIPAVLRLTRRLAPRRPRPLARRLLVGRHPLPDTSRVVSLPGKAHGARHRLRYLDKREDLFTFLRFADCVPCCFDSANPWYQRQRMGWWVLSLWKDPLSFCFHVERSDSGVDWTPCGFVFGGYSLGHDTPTMLLNGIYLRHQETRLRAAILRAIEDTVCKPLGIFRVAIANSYAGHGALPPEYIQRPLTIHRLRALRSNAGPESRIYDDISSTVNRTSMVSHLFWRRL